MIITHYLTKSLTILLSNVALCGVFIMNFYDMMVYITHVLWPKVSNHFIIKTIY